MNIQRTKHRSPARHKILFSILCLVLLTQVLPTQAYSGAFFPTQSIGNRGTDVKAVQYLLNVGPDGVFGAGTERAVKDFQAAHGLAADGIVGSVTWSQLTPTLRLGSRGNAVRALQTLLNEKRSTKLVVDGIFGSGTLRAVKEFQSHAGIGRDGVVGPTSWKQLLWHYEYPLFGSTLCDVDPDGNGNANWGTAAAIGQLEAAARSFASTGNGSVPVGDLSFEHGGSINGHASHMVGLDVDVWPIRTDNQQCLGSRITWQSGSYDRAATRQLIQAIRGAAPGHIKFIYFNDPELIRAGLTTAYPNHDNHIHVRYCEKFHPNSAYDCKVQTPSSVESKPLFTAEATHTSNAARYAGSNQEGRGSRTGTPDFLILNSPDKRRTDHVKANKPAHTSHVHEAYNWTRGLGCWWAAGHGTKRRGVWLVTHSSPRP